MRNDNTTLKDLSIFGTGGEDVFSLIDFTTTAEGRATLRAHLQQPPPDFAALQRMQDTVRWWGAHPHKWTNAISNGTLVLLEKFYEAADSVSAPPTGVLLVMGSWLQKLVNKNQYTFIQFSLAQLTDLMQGCSELVGLLEEKDLPEQLQTELQLIAQELLHPLVPTLLKINKRTPYAELSRIAFRARRELKGMVQRLTTYYARLDAWQSMGRATVVRQWAYPELTEHAELQLEAKGLYHPLLHSPVGYDISFAEGKNFLLLTGANMSGKTTFMRALGVAALLAHAGMGVPAASLRLSFLQGVITNMHVEDNILKGESYFFAEVQRMKQTARRLTEDAPFLVLMDELFKGTNVHDAYECTRAVVEGLLQRPNHLYILSTHIHEVAHHFEARKDMLFAYFVIETAADGEFHFTYQLKSGISNDRIGYRILQQEGVIDLLKGNDQVV